MEYSPLRLPGNSNSVLGFKWKITFILFGLRSGDWGRVLIGQGTNVTYLNECIHDHEIFNLGFKIRINQLLTLDLSLIWNDHFIWNYVFTVAF